MNRKLFIIGLSISLTACGTTSLEHIGQSNTSISSKPSGQSPATRSTDRQRTRPETTRAHPKNLHQVPNAVPQKETLHPYANRPYVALGKKYTPLQQPGRYKQRGIASWYGKKFHGERTSSGEIYDMYGMTAAHPILPIPSYARVTNPANQRSVIVKINDRGPFVDNRIIDLSYTAAYQLGLSQQGHGEVIVESLSANGTADPTVTTVTTAAAVRAEKPSVRSLPPTSNTNKTPEKRGSGIFLQLGAFKQRSGADKYLKQMQQKLNNVASQPLQIYSHNNLSRIYIGPFSSKDHARIASDKIEQAIGFKPLLRQHSADQ